MNPYIVEKDGKKYILFHSHNPNKYPKLDIPIWVFSNWYLSKFEMNGIQYSSREQFIMKMKAILFKDYDTVDKIMATSDPEEIKALGRQVKNFDNKVWTEKLPEIARAAVHLDFSQNEELKKALLDTGDAILVEASPRDAIWGIGLSAQDAFSGKTWGRNELGEALMDVRKELNKNETKVQLIE